MKSILALLLAAVAGCYSRPCITPPPASSEETRQLTVGLAAQLAAIPVSPKLETDFKATVNTAYQQLSDANAIYFIALQSALCFAEEGKWGKDVAGRILLDLEADWKARTGAPSSDSHPQAAEVKAMIQQGQEVPR